MATKKKENAVPEIIDNVEALEAKMKAMREAQKKFATYTQEQVDKIFFEAAMAANKMRIPLAKMAVEEIRLSKTITQQSTFTISTKTIRHAA